MTGLQYFFITLAGLSLMFDSSLTAGLFLIWVGLAGLLHGPDEIPPQDN